MTDRFHQPNTFVMSLPFPVVMALLVVGILTLVGALVFVLMRQGQGKTDGKSRKRRDRSTVLNEANKALAQNPKDPEALTDLADLYFSEGQWDKANKTYGMLVELCATNPNLDEAEFTKRYAISALKLKNIQEAYRSFLIARTLSPESFDVNYNLGYLEYRNKNYEKAANLLKQALDQKNEHVPSMQYLGLSYFKLKRYNDAITLLRHYLEVKPEDKEALFVMGQCYFELGKSEQAQKVFSHLRADPQVGPRAALYSGSIHLKARRLEDAEMDFELGLRHEHIKSDVELELKYRLATAYTNDQRLDRAVQLLGEISAVKPDYKDVKAQLSKLRELNSNRNLQTYLIAPPSEFVTLCRKMTNEFFPQSHTKITDIAVRKSDYADILADVETAKWEDTVVFRFVRTTGQVGELLMRDLHSRIKEMKAGRGFCVTAGTFSDGAKAFVEARLIDLVEKDELIEILKRY